MKLLKFILLSGVSLLVVTTHGCRRTSNLSDLHARQSPDWIREAVLYEISPRAFSTEGTFQGMSEHLRDLRNLGVTVLVVEPIHPVGELNRQGVMGNLYSVRDYYEVNEDFGTLEDFKALVTQAHADTLRVLLDLVAGYTSWDSQLLMEHPEWFRKNDEGSIISPKPDWVDVAALNYEQHELRKYMINMMKYWIRETRIDGFRCPDADLVPVDFWEIARNELESIKPVCMITESPSPLLHLNAFDISCSWGFFDTIDSLGHTLQAASDLDSAILDESRSYPKGSLFARFDDERRKNSQSGPVRVRLGENASRVALVLAFTIPGVPLIFMGEGEGNTEGLSLHEKSEIVRGGRNSNRALLSMLCRWRSERPSLRRGEFNRLANSAGGTIFSFMRSTGSDRVLVIANLSKDAQEFSLVLPTGLPADFHDVDSQEHLSLNQNPWRFKLEGFGYKILASNDGRTQQ